MLVLMKCVRGLGLGLGLGFGFGLRLGLRFRGLRVRSRHGVKRWGKGSV